MNDGLDGDDRWIMVEDEFMSTAKEYTRHLHQAEYDRLRQLAKKRNTSAIYSITSTAHPGASKETRVRKKAAALDKAQMQLLGSSAGDSDDDDDPWAANPHLASLVSRVQQPSAKLSQMAGITCNTRASLGFAQSEEQSQRQFGKRRPGPAPEPDNLDETQYARQSSHERLREERHLMSGTKREVSPENNVSLDTSRVQLKREASPTHPSHLPAASTASAKMARVNFSDRMARRRQGMVKRKQEEESPLSMDQVPTFLI